MASKAAIAERRYEAVERLDAGCQALVLSLGIELPAKPPHVRQPELAHALHVEYMADVVNLIAQTLDDESQSPKAKRK